MSVRLARLVLLLVLPVAIVAAAVPWFIYEGLLPDPLASHFDLNGVPNGSMSRAGFFAQTGGFAAFGMALCAATVLFSRKIAPPYAALLALFGGFIGGLGSSILSVTALTQHDAYVWTNASGPGVWSVYVVVVAALFGVVGARAGSSLPQADRKRSTLGRPASTTITLNESERAVWTGTQEAPWVLAIALGLIAMSAAGALIWAWPFAFLALGGIGISALANVHARADRAGLHVRYGFLPWPTTEIAIDQIRRATVLEIRPVEWDGWGYRGSLKLMDQAAVIHRAGPGLRLDLVDDKVFVITVDDPDGAAALLTAAAGSPVTPEPGNQHMQPTQ